MSGKSTVRASGHLLGVKCIDGDLKSQTLGSEKNPIHCLTNLLILLEKLCENDSTMPDIFAFQEYEGDGYIENFFTTGDTKIYGTKRKVVDNVKKFRYVKGGPSSGSSGVEKLITFYNTQKIDLHYYNFSYYQPISASTHRAFQILIFGDKSSSSESLIFVNIHTDSNIIATEDALSTEIKKLTKSDKNIDRNINPVSIGLSPANNSDYRIIIAGDFNTEWHNLPNNFYKGFTPFSKSGLNFADIAVFGLNQGNTHLTHLLI